VSEQTHQTSASVQLDGITTRYDIAGAGPPLLLFSPGGFNAVRSNWRTLGIYQRTALLESLRKRFTCITFDKRESGESSGRVERIGWADYVRQGVALVDHLGYDQFHVMGGCVGCSIAIGLAVAHSERVKSMVLYSPAGGVKYRIKQHSRFNAHLTFAVSEGLGAVVSLAEQVDASFADDGRVGPWVSVLRNDREFADRYRRLDIEWYQTAVSGMARLLFDRDTVPGAEPEDLLTLDIPALIVPGEDTSHAPSAARYLQECLQHGQYWDAPVASQTAQAAPARVLDFLHAF
jgi:pimeloyl-ACP methyl ester carboxylesterase